MQRQMLGDGCRMGVFYDGGFFDKVNGNYLYNHPVQRRIWIPGLHKHIERSVADFMRINRNTCRIVDAHYFGSYRQDDRGLVDDRPMPFWHALSRMGVESHLRPLGFGNKQKGVDTDLALTAYRCAMQDELDTVVLVAGDADHIPIVEHLHDCRKQVVIVGGSFPDSCAKSDTRGTYSSRKLMEAADYRIWLDCDIDRWWRLNDPMMNMVFMPSSKVQTATARMPQPCDRPHHAA